MAAPIVQFEIGCRDRKKIGAFYAEVLGWGIGGGANEYADAIENAGLAGHIVALGHEPHNYVMVYGEVEDIDATCDQVEKSGGARHIGPLPIPGGRRFAWIKDPEGALFGLIDKKG